MSLYLACGLTMAIETAYFFLIGYRERSFLIVCLAVNAATNLSMNLILKQTGVQIGTVIIAEIIVVAVEFAAYCLVSKPPKALLLHTSIANVLSLLIGGILLKTFLG